MNCYYHIYPTCPTCHEPHVSKTPLERIDNVTLKCLSCGAVFYRYIDLISQNKFTTTIETIKNNEGVKKQEYFKKVPLVWRISLNPIENQYIEWINQNVSGKYLITWPWKEVKFLPILISEYLLNNPNKKVAVIGEVKSPKNDDIRIMCPTINEIFENIFQLQEPIEEDIPEALKKEIKKFDKKSVLKKVEVFDYEISKAGSDRLINTIFDTNSRKIKRIIVNEAKMHFGENPIREIKIKLDEHEPMRSEIKNKDGVVDIKIEKKTRWTGDIKYRSEWFWNVLLNSKKLRRWKKSIFTIWTNESEKNNIKNQDIRLIFISSENDPEEIFKSLKIFEPNLLIIQNSDDFIKDSIYRKEKSNALLSFLDDNNNSLILMFSTTPDIRHLYCMYYNNDIFKKSNILNYKVIPHTWDSNIFITSLKNERIDEESVYLNPVSSLWDELASGGQIPETEYIEVENIDKLDIFLEKILSIIEDNAFKNSIKKYICDLKRSPLFIKGDYQKLEVFKRFENNQKITYEFLISIISQRSNETELKDIEKLIELIYYTKSNELINPIMNAIIDKIKSLIEIKENWITIVVHYFDVKGTIELLNKMNIINDDSDRISVCSWNDLSQREHNLEIRKKLDEKIQHYVISTLYPSIKYPIYFTKVKKFVFIGSIKNIKKIEIIIKKRMMETISRPIYLLSKDEFAPKMLKEIQAKVDIPPKEILQNISEEIFSEFNESLTDEGSPEIVSKNTSSLIEIGEQAIIVIEGPDKGMFIPLDHSLSVIDNNNERSEFRLGNISSKEELKSKLIGKRILIDKYGFYISFKSIFIKIMMNNAKSVIFKHEEYTWNGFQNLYNDSIEWISILEDALELFSIKNKLSASEAEKRFVEYIVSLKLFAKGPIYIHNWWSKYEKISSECNEYYIYNVEHPRSLEDIKKIYNGINKLLPEMKLNLKDAEKTYYASRTIQKIRISLFKGNLENSIFLRPQYDLLQQEIKTLLEISAKFVVNVVDLVLISKEVKPFTILKQYNEYIKKSL